MLINTRFKRLSFPYDHTVNSESTFRSDWPGTLLKVSIRANRPRRIWIPGHRRRRQAGCFVVFSRHVGTGYQVHDTCSQTWKFFRGAPASSLSSLLISNQAWPAVSTEWSISPIFSTVKSVFQRRCNLHTFLTRSLLSSWNSYPKWDESQLKLKIAEESRWNKFSNAWVAFGIPISKQYRNKTL